MKVVVQRSLKSSVSVDNKVFETTTPFSFSILYVSLFTPLEPYCFTISFMFDSTFLLFVASLAFNIVCSAFAIASSSGWISVRVLPKGGVKPLALAMGI